MKPPTQQNSTEVRAPRQAYDVHTSDVTEQMRPAVPLSGLGGLAATGALVLLLLSSCSSGGGGGPEGNANTAESRIASSTDDVEETPTGRVQRSSTDLELVRDETDQLIGLRFTDVDVPREAVVTDAYVSFTADEASSEKTSLTVHGVAEDDPPTFVSARFNVSSQTNTTASVAWSPPPWLTPGASGPEQRTPNLAPIVQEIVSRPGWSSGNALALVISGTGRRTAESFDGSRLEAPLLHVTFTADERVSIDAFAAQPAEVRQEREVTFSWSISATDGGAVSCTLDVDGDHTPDYTIAGCLTKKTQTHTYEVAGYFPAMLTATSASGATTTVTAEVAVTSPRSVTVAAAGDIACDPASEYFNNGAGSADRCHMKATSDLVLAMKPTAVLTLGDNQYDSATLENFRQSYDPTWGRFKPITHPAPGTHEYDAEDDEDDRDGSGEGYFAYFGAAAGDPDKGYYSFDLGAWHIVVLNTSCSQVGGCDSGSPQERWLRADLAASPKPCTLAVMHEPRFSSGKHGSIEQVIPFWHVLHKAGVELVLSGNDHDYERFAPQTPDGVLDAEGGVRQFVVGTGGKELYSFGTLQPHSEARIGGVYGVLKLDLHPESYNWEFVPEAGRTSDKGMSICH